MSWTTHGLLSLDSDRGGEHRCAHEVMNGALAQVLDLSRRVGIVGFDPQGGGYAGFVAGYTGTGRQTVTRLSESGDQVSACR